MKRMLLLPQDMHCQAVPLDTLVPELHIDVKTPSWPDICPPALQLF